MDDHDLGRKKSSDAEMLRTFSTGLLADCLAGYPPKNNALYFLFFVLVCGSMLTFYTFGLITEAVLR